METIPIEKLTKYNTDSSPQVIQQLIKLPAPAKPVVIIEKKCLNELKEDFSPSNVNDIPSLFKEEFGQQLLLINKVSNLTSEIMNLINDCVSMFELLGFTEERRKT